MSNQKQSDRRRNTRVDFKTDIVLTVGSSEFKIEGNSKDLSLKGIFIRTDAAIPDMEKCHVDIFLSGMIEPVALKMDGRIVRRQDDGIAIEFESMDLDSYTHLKNVVRYNTMDIDEIDVM